MKKSLILILLSFAGLAKAQTPLATTAASGSSSTVNGMYYAEIIGQNNAVVGTHSSPNAVLLQGFKQPGLVARSIQDAGFKVNTEQVNPIRYTIYPNPMVNQLNIQFSATSTAPSYVAIYNFSGILQWSGRFTAGITNIAIPEVKSLESGKYILHIVSVGKPFAGILLKE